MTGEQDDLILQFTDGLAWMRMELLGPVMSDIITGLRRVIQDMVAPDLKAHTAKLEALQNRTEMLQKLTEFQYDSIMATFEAFRAEMRPEFASLRANIQYGSISPACAAS